MIACLGWGSLIWDPRTLSIKSNWFDDGPHILVEFVRVSSDGRLTLVIDPSMLKVRCLWVLMNTATLNDAIDNLRARERIPRNNGHLIGRWTTGQNTPAGISDLQVWAQDKGIQSVIWTALGPRFQGQNGRVPTEDEAVAYLQGLHGNQRNAAEEYIRRTPHQIDTAYRKRFEADLGWTPI